MMNKIVIHLAKSILLALCVLLGACTLFTDDEDCVGPYDGTRSDSKTINVPASGNAWTSLGVTVVSGSQKVLTIANGVNLCAGAANTQNILVHSMWCTNGTLPTYPTSGQALSEQIVCPGSNIALNSTPLIDSGITFYDNDYITVSVIPSTYKLTSCITPPAEISIDQGTYQGTNSKPISAIDICKSGGDVVLNGANVALQAMEGMSYTVAISNSLGPDGNKWIVNYSNDPSQVGGPNAQRYWFTGAAVDLRVKDAVPDISKFNCNAPMSGNYKGNDALKINEQCGYFCGYGTEQNFRTSSKCVATEITTKINKSVNYGFGSTITREPLTDKDHPTGSWGLPGLILCGDTNVNVGSGSIVSARQCSSVLNAGKNVIPGLPTKVSVSNDPKHKRFLRVGIDPIGVVPLPATYSLLGGYNLKVQRMCPRINGDGLYLYVGTDPTTAGVKPGDINTYHIGDRSNFSMQYTINSSDTNVTNLAGGVYMMVAQRAGETGSGSYSITVREDSVPPIISTAFAAIYKIVANVLMGPKDANGQRNGGVISTLYNTMATELVKDVAMIALSLYVAVISMGFLTGLVGTAAKDLFARLIRVGIVMTLIGDRGWTFVNTYLIPLTLNASDWLNSIFLDYFNLDSAQGENQFGFLDLVLSLFLSESFAKKMLSLPLQGLVGITAFFLVLRLMWQLTKFTGTLMILYLVVYLSLTMVVATLPILALLSLWAITRQFLPKTVSICGSVIFQLVLSVILFLSLGELLRFFVVQLFAFSVCKECLIGVNLGAIGNICLLFLYTPLGFSSNLNIEDRMIEDSYRNSSLGEHFMGMGIDVTLLFSIWCLSEAVQFMTPAVISMAEGIFGTQYTNMSNTADNIAESLKSFVGLDQESVRRRKAAEHLKKREVDDGDSKNDKEQTQPRNKGASNLLGAGSSPVGGIGGDGGSLLGGSTEPDKSNYTDLLHGGERKIEYPDSAHRDSLMGSGNGNNQSDMPEASRIDIGDNNTKRSSTPNDLGSDDEI